ncbi:hypothetical protein NN561_013206 [Cricetulus griseus]
MPNHRPSSCRVAEHLQHACVRLAACRDLQFHSGVQRPLRGQEQGWEKNKREETAPRPSRPDGVSSTFFSETTARLSKGGVPVFSHGATAVFESDIIRDVRLSVAAWAELSWDQPSFDSPGQSGKRLQFPPSGDSQAATELWAPPTCSQHLPAPPAAVTPRVRELQLQADLAAFATRLPTTYPRRLRATRPLQECCPQPGPGYPVNPVGSFSRSFIEKVHLSKTPEH